MSNLVVTSINGHIMRVEINNPEKKNTLSDGVVNGLYDAFVAANSNPQVRVLVLSGRGELFCGGGDLDHFKTNPFTDGYKNTPIYRLMTEMFRCQKPIVAAVQGAAVGGGSTILLSCDIVAAAESASFLLPFSSLGICTELGSSYLLPLTVGMRRAAKWVLMAEPIAAGEALEAGFVTEVVADCDLASTTHRYAKRLAELPPSSLRHNKALLRRAHESAINDNFEQEWKILEEAFVGEEIQEAIQAFMEKRPADFSRFT